MALQYIAYEREKRSRMSKWEGYIGIQLHRSHLIPRGAWPLRVVQVGGKKESDSLHSHCVQAGPP